MPEQLDRPKALADVNHSGIPSTMKRQTVAVVYHFIAHYRQPIFDELLNCSPHHYVLCADRKNRLMPGVDVWNPEDPARFRECRSIVVYGKMVWQVGLIALAKDPDIDTIIYLGDWKWPSTWLSAQLAKRHGKRVLFWTHGWRRPDRGIKRLLRRSFYRLADGLLLYGNWAKQVGCDEGFDANKLYVVYNSAGLVRAEPSFDPNRIESTRAELFPGSDPKTPVVCCCSRLTKRRRLDLLLQAVARLNAAGHPVHVLLIGDGPEKKQLEQLSSDLGIRVRFVGQCYDPDELEKLYSACNVTVSPGSIGLTAIQSMSHGIPVISHGDVTSQGPEAEAIVPGETGAFYQLGDFADLARKIRDWTKTPYAAPKVRQTCMQLIQSRYTPAAQRAVFDAAITGESATNVAQLLEQKGD